MFRRRQRVRDTTPDESAASAERERFTYLQHGTVVTGTLEASGRVRVHGTIHGDVEVDGLLEVAPDGVIEGASVKAGSLVVLGRVRANVEVPGKVEVWKDGHLEGDVQAGALDIEEGATFVGRSAMPGREGPPQLAAPIGPAQSAEEAAPSTEEPAPSAQEPAPSAVEAASSMEEQSAVEAASSTEEPAPSAEMAGGSATAETEQREAQS